MCDEGLACEHRWAEGEQRGQWVNLLLGNPPPPPHHLIGQKCKIQKNSHNLVLVPIKNSLGYTPLKVDPCSF